MSPFALSDRAKKALLAGWPADLGPSPFETRAGRTIMHYDGLRIEDAGDAVGGVKVVFLWHGNDTAWMRVEGTGMAGGCTLTLHGISGHTDVDLK